MGKDISRVQYEVLYRRYEGNNKSYNKLSALLITFLKSFLHFRCSYKVYIFRGSRVVTIQCLPMNLGIIYILFP